MAYLIKNNTIPANPLGQSMIVKTPYRISLGGGGTDLPFYLEKKSGFLITSSINQYMTVSVALRILDDKLFVQTTDNQFAHELDELRHVLIRETLRYFKISHSIQVATYSTLPTQTGLGASSTLIVGLVHALSNMVGKRPTALEIAATAHHIEREMVGDAGGLQDQYIAALGGIQILKIEQDGTVNCEHLVIEEHNRHELERGLVLIYSKKDRVSAEIINSQQQDLRNTLEIYDEIKNLGIRSVDILKKADVEKFGLIMDEHWKLKRSLSGSMTNTELDETYLFLKKLGSPGGKIIGAGGGGFFMMAVPGKVDEYLEKVRKNGFRNLDWQFEFEGSHVIDYVPH